MRPLGLILSAAMLLLTACGLGSPHVPDALTDDEFWRLSTEMSEPPGGFEHSDNLVSNELHFVHVLRLLRPAGGGAYIGVGPEQNFSYIARIRPAIAFIVDIRQENRNFHLLYKALFELSADRADFLSRLLSRARPPGVGSRTTVGDLFEAYENVPPNEGIYQANARLIRERLLTVHRLALTPQDFAWIDYALHAFYSDGPAIHYGRLRPTEEPEPSYRALMTAVDVAGQSHSFLASEDAFAFVKDLQSKNRLVPVVGDFGGSEALRRVGGYIREHGTRVRAFYASNVEVYLNRQKMAAFCGSLARLPYDSRTWYIGSKGMQPLSAKLKSCAAFVKRT